MKFPHRCVFHNDFFSPTEFFHFSIYPMLHSVFAILATELPMIFFLLMCVMLRYHITNYIKIHKIVSHPIGHN